RTLVPFIHKVSPRLKYVMNYQGYPNSSHVDPTRRLNISNGVIRANITMHHYSYVRKNMALKLENSSANFKDTRVDVVYEDLANAKSGYFLKGYQKTLTECENIFNLPIYD